jgi:hypothetical protein
MGKIGHRGTCTWAWVVRTRNNKHNTILGAFRLRFYSRIMLLVPARPVFGGRSLSCLGRRCWWGRWPVAVENRMPSHPSIFPAQQVECGFGAGGGEVTEPVATGTSLLFLCLVSRTDMPLPEIPSTQVNPGVHSWKLTDADLGNPTCGLSRPGAREKAFERIFRNKRCGR